MRVFRVLRLILTLLTCWSLHTQAQVKDIYGVPNFKTFTSQDFNWIEQNLTATQWHDGTLIVGGVSGILQHAENNWRNFGKLDVSFVNILNKSEYSQNVLWVGSQSNFGYYLQNPDGEFQYWSLSNTLSDEFLVFDRILSIQETEKEVLYLSDQFLFRYEKGADTVLVSDVVFQGDAHLTHLFKKKGDLFGLFNDGTIRRYNNGDWNLFHYEGERVAAVHSSVPFGEIVYLLDEEKGILIFDGNEITPYKSRLDDYIQTKGVKDFDVFDDGKVAIVTITDELLVFDQDGNLSATISANTGLPSDNINDIFIDNAGDVWLSGNENVIKVFTSIPITRYESHVFGMGDVLDIITYKGENYFASYDGLYKGKLPVPLLGKKNFEGYFKRLNSENEEFYEFSIIDGELWVSSTKGIYKIENQKLVKIVEDNSTWFEKTEIDGTEIILHANLDGVKWLKKEQDKWVDKGQIEGIDTYIFKLETTPEDVFWAGTVQGFAVKGIYDSSSDSFTLQEYGSEDGLPFSDIYSPTWIDGKLIMNSKRGVAYYNEQEDSFTEITSINSQLGNWVDFLNQDEFGNLWTSYTDIFDYRAIVEFEPDTQLEWKRIYTPFEITDHIFDNFLKVNEDKLWAGATEAFYYMDLNLPFERIQPEVHIWEIISLFDQQQLAFGTDKPQAIPYNQKNIGIEFASTSFRVPEKNEFRFKLRNQEWSEWRTDPRFIFNEFLPGTYSLQVQTRDFVKTNSEPVTFQVTILAPWYLTRLAYALYLVFFVGAIAIFIRAVSSYRIKQQMNQLKLQEIEKIIELDELKTRLLINISHELRTPLTLVNGPIKQLLDSGKVDDEYLIRKLQVAHRNGRRLHDLVEQVLDLSRLDSNIMDFTPGQIQFGTFTRRVCESFESSADRKSISINIDIPENEILFQGDVDKLEKILVNLLSNAIKFTPEHGSIYVTVKEEEHAVHIQVKDSGRGISSTDLEHVFDRFHSTSDQLEGGGQGIGVGLSITKEFVELHGGKIRVESSEGKGALFVVTLPKKEYEDYEEAEFKSVEDSFEKEQELEVSAPLSIRKNGQLYSALVVEDNPDMRVYISELLGELGISVEQAANGIEGKKQVSVKKPDIIISDIMMPEMNGFEFASWVRSVPESRQIPVILLSARSEVEDKVYGFEIGVSDYLTKPFNAQELQARVDNLLTLKKEREQFSNQEEESTLSADAELVQQLQEFVESKIGNNDISVDDLAASASMSVRNLQRILKSVTGFTPVEFIREVRLYAARDLLETKQKRTVSEVAYAVGFSTPSYFSKLYKKRFGTSPAEYF